MSRDPASPPPDVNGLAMERTDLAWERNLLAAERTYSAWLRTGLAAVAGGFGIARLFETMRYPWLPRLIGGMFIVGGIGAYLLALFHYKHIRVMARTRGESAPPIWALRLLVAGLILASLLALASLLIH